MAMNVYNEIAEVAKAQDEREQALGDTFDIKTSIALVVITFLATQSESLLKATERLGCWHTVQRISVVFLAIAGTLAIIELIPRNYRFRMPLDKYVSWADGVLASYKNPEVDVTNPEEEALAYIEREEIKKAKDRFLANRAINDRKSWYMHWSFWATVAALITNLLTLAYISYG
jgi:hypothetical protein